MRAEGAELATISIAKPRTPPPPAMKPPSSPWWATRTFVVTAAILLLISTFAVGALVNVIGSRTRVSDGDKEPASPPEAVTTSARADPVGDLRLVPADDPAATAGQVITSAPVPDPDRQMPAESQRSDATALPAEQYSRVLKDARPTPPPQSAVADPRTVEGSVPNKVVPREEAAPAPEREVREPPTRQPTRQPRVVREVEGGKRTNPVPTYQPLPRIDRKREITRDGTCRLALAVGRDGRVKEIQVLESIPGLTPKIISAVQRWRFKPATLNGEPVDGTFEVDITLNALD